MRVNLLQPDRGYVPSPRMAPNKGSLVDDLELETLYRGMAAGDEFIYDVVQQVLPASMTDPRGIVYRQEVLEDCMANPDLVIRMFRIVSEAVESRPKGAYAGFLFRAPEGVLHRSVEQLELLVARLRELRGMRDSYASRFKSDGFRQLFAMLAEQLDDAYLAQLEEYLAELRFPNGVLFSASLGTGNKGSGFVLHRPSRRSWRERAATRGFVAADDQASARAVVGQGIYVVANTMAQTAEHVLDFYQRLRTELAFYVGCLHLWQRLGAAGVPLCFPIPTAMGEQFLRTRDLRDVGLCLTTADPVVGNDVEAYHKSLILVTGANAGGKSTFLRSVGNAQLMMQAGMFVTAESFTANVRDGVFTHFTQEEDAAMEHGKLDEELARMSDIVDRINPGSLLLCNESFYSANDREGSQIARQVVRAMTDSGVKVIFVTHHYDLAYSRWQEGRATDLFLRAERGTEGNRTHRLIEAEPSPTSHGQDSFRRIFPVRNRGSH